MAKYIISACLFAFFALANTLATNKAYSAPPDHVLERRLERNKEKKAEKRVAKGLEKQLERRAEQAIEKNLQKNLAKSLEKSNQGKGSIMSDPEARQAVLEELKANGKTNKIEQDTSTESFSQISPHSLKRGKKGHYAVRYQWLALVDKESLPALKSARFKITKQTNLSSLNKILVEIHAPIDRSFDEFKDENIQLLEHTSIDQNHIYLQQNQEPNTATSTTTTDWQPYEAIQIPSNKEHKSLKIGIIDSEVDINHPAFSSAFVRKKSFIAKSLEEPKEHGTAVASIIVGKSKQFQGLVPSAKLYSASVFYKTTEIPQAADTIGLIRAIDWLTHKKVDVVNMSLSGPPNSVLEVAIKIAQEKGMTFVAAVGNAGPNAVPLFPAAYDGVISVTAVNRDNFAWHNAVRGKHVDFSAPGVDIMHASAKGHYKSSSGTSFASPFVATLVSLAKMLVPEQIPYETLVTNTLDIGAKGMDQIYGHGLIQYWHH